MPDFFKPLIRTANWIKTRNQESADPPCALASCAGPHSLWQRFRKRRRPSGTFLQGVFYCRPQCLETALIASFLACVPWLRRRRRPPHSLGLLMVARGKLTYLEVRAASKPSAAPVTEKSAIGSKNSVLLRNRKSPPPRPAMGMPRGLVLRSLHDSEPGSIPLPILEAFQMLPINYVASTNTLYLAFGERVDHAALYAIERVLDCRTQPALLDARGLPINSTPCANCPGRATLNSAP